MDYVNYVVGFIVGQLAWGFGVLYDYFSQAPPWALWIAVFISASLGYAIGDSRRMSGPTREDTVRRLVADRIIDMLMRMCDDHEISWEEAAAEMTRLGRSPRWTEFRPKRLDTYALSRGEQLQLKGLIRARRKARKNGKPVVFPGDEAQPKETGSIKSAGFDKLLASSRRNHNL